MRSRRIHLSCPSLAVREQACMCLLPFCERRRPAVPVRPCSGSWRKRQWKSDTMEQERGENVLGCGFRQQIRTPRARYTPSGLKSQRDGPPTAADHEIGPFSAISAPFGLKRGGMHALVHRRAGGRQRWRARCPHLLGCASSSTCVHGAASPPARAAARRRGADVSWKRVVDVPSRSRGVVGKGGGSLRSGGSVRGSVRGHSG